MDSFKQHKALDAEERGLLSRRQALTKTGLALGALGGAGTLLDMFDTNFVDAKTSHKGLTPAMLRQLHAEVNAAKRRPTFHAPGPAFNSKPARGKHVFYLSLDQSIPIVQVLANAMTEAANAAGLKSTIFDGKSEQTLYVTGMQQAINQKADVILIESVASGTLKQPILKAKAAGIKVIQLNELSPIPEVDAKVTLPYLLAAQLEADWVLIDSKGKNVNAVLFIAPFPTHFSMANVVKKRFEKFIPGQFKLRTQIVSFADWQTRLPVLTRTLMTSDPQINYMIPVVDGQCLFIVPSLHQAGHAQSVKISTFNATEGVMQLMKDHNVVGSDSGQDSVYAGWAYIDQALRVLTGHKPLRGAANEKIPDRMFDRQNVGSVALNQTNTWFDNNGTHAGFKRLWGVG